MESLDRLIRALQHEARSTSAGEMAISAQLVGFLSQRLHVEDWHRHHPEIEDEIIESPLFGVSLPRTGSTALAFLLAEDPGSDPCAHGRPRSLVHRHRRSRVRIPGSSEPSGPSRCSGSIRPGLAALVPPSAKGPRDCQMLLGLDVKAPLFYAFACIPSYVN
jgi:hypothetical protein